ncbi:MAG: UvrD-helicase domain-containing protein [Nitrospirota bacterium]|nr:UvrD-helicase domain-containing protein [Nitrospirota bacterium]
MSDQLPDAAARAAALDPARSFIVQAPAGSGKTGLLIQRLLILLAGARQPEEIVAITFTRKAAGEMAERILRALDAAAENSVPDDPHARVTWELATRVLARDKECGWNLRDNPARLQVQTFDAFCLGLVRRLPFLSELGGGIGIAEDARGLHRLAAERLMGLLDHDQYGAAVATLLAHEDGDANRAAEGVAGMLARRDQWLRHLDLGVDDDGLIAALTDGIRRVVFDALEDAAEKLSPWAGRLAPLVRQFAAARDVNVDDAFACRRDDRLEDWQHLVDLLLTGKGELRRTVTAREGFPAGKEGQSAKQEMAAILSELADLQGVSEMLGELRTLPHPEEVAAHRDTLLHLRHALHLAAALLREVFSERRQGDFAEVAAGALLALGDEDRPTDLALALDTAIGHILVDEFQDTSHGQFNLLARLTAGWTPGDGRSLFLVGDPMQSIYRFRDAEVGLYLRARRFGIGQIRPEPLFLSANFRSRPAVVAWVNRAFPHVLPEREDISRGAVRYEPSHAVRGNASGAAVEVHPLALKDDAEEARIVARVAAQALAESADGRVAVLVRARGHLSAILPALSAAGIPYRAVDIDPLSNTPVVRDLIALTRAMSFPADRVAWLAVLRAPWCGLTLADLLVVAGEPGTAICDRLAPDALPTLLSALSADGRGRLARVVETLTEGLDRRGAGRLAGRLETAWVRLGGPGCYGADALRQADRYLELLDGLDDGGPPPSPLALQQVVADLFAEFPGAVRVEVMTVHKAKGLEWDTVILPGLGRYTKGDTGSLLGWMERPVRGAEGISDLILAPVGERGGERDAVYQWIHRTHRERARHEEGRLLYVAATRAQRRLHLIGHAAWKEDHFVADSRSLLARLWPVVESAFADLDPPGDEGATVRPLPPPLLRLPVDFALPRPAKPVGRPGPAPEVDPYAPSFTWAGDMAPAVGTVVHRALQRIAGDGLTAWDVRRIREATPRWAAALTSLGMAPEVVAAGAERVVRVLSHALGDERGKWVLAPHAEAKNEFAVGGVLANGQVIHRVMDRTFVADGTRWIIDYKTGGHAGGGLEQFLAEEQRRYTPQLEEYGLLMRGLDDRPIRLGLYFPAISGWREWG